MEKKQAIEQTDSNPLHKIILLIGFLVMFIGCVVAVCSFNSIEPVFYIACGLTSALSGLTLIGFSFIVKAAILYININEE